LTDPETHIPLGESHAELQQVLLEYLYQQSYPYHQSLYATGKTGYDRATSRQGVRTGAPDDLKQVPLAWDDDDPDYAFQQAGKVKEKGYRYSFGHHLGGLKDPSEKIQDVDVIPGAVKDETPPVEGKRTGTNKERIGQKFDPNYKRSPEKPGIRLKRITKESTTTSPNSKPNLEENQAWMLYHYFGPQYDEMKEMTSAASVGSYSKPMWFCSTPNCGYQAPHGMYSYEGMLCPYCRSPLAKRE